MKQTHGQRINSIPEGGAAVLEKIPGGGSLEARRLRSGNVMLYFRYTVATKTAREPIGTYDSSAAPKSLSPTPRGYSVAAALEAARELSKRNRETPGGLRAERERVESSRKAEEHAKVSAAKYTLRALCTDYAAWLEKQGKSSHSDALGIFTNHLFAPYPETADKPAALVEKREIVTAVRRLTEAGKGATARKLRSYLRAAYACAVKADSDAALPLSFIEYNVTTNPVEATAAIKGRADKNPLPADQLRRYWKALQDEPGVIGAALRLHVLSGGQRTAQLARLKDTDVTTDTFQILDRKGKRSEARVHLLPITKPIRAELSQLSKSGFVLSTDGGITSMHSTSLSTWAAEVAKRAKVPEFQLKRVRSGIETMLAEARIPLHIRGQLQSHGIGGVQEKHYDAFSYLPEKRQALDALHNLLQAKPARNVTPSRRKAA